MSAEELTPAHLLDWDSAFFGFRIAQLTRHSLTDELADQVIRWCSRNDIRCLYFLAASDDPQTVVSAEKHGLRLVDVRLTLELCLNGDSPPPSRSVRPYQHADLEALRQIAAVSHRDSRFYFDPGFPGERCDALYQTWIEQSCRGYAQGVLVIESDSGPGGYITCHLAEDGVGSIGLIAVSANARGKGLGRKLVNSAISWFSERNTKRVSVVTQGRNIGGQRLYQNCGFRTCACQLWYHWWSSPKT
jgi:dTDP-4-amino-4,6-dideoxy-D-galactose acyltransferase